ncbi:hypothetical protein RN001_011183 [Aquatica leii]|uniref:Amine oxidase domain-containing protein n=1 Tax=Aquatica leii TaxID=1421715 RepID=A0AAN7PXI9_9COLE|nr:hypothetical protein RN001_011183 [Aquatica leii]
MTNIHLRLLSLLLLTHFANCRNPSVVIVGAGAAGIAAASRLLENGITNVTILEAEDRIGGRIHSVKFDDNYVDLGAEWCHGQENNVVYNLVKNFNLLKPIRETFPNLFHSKANAIDVSFKNELFGIFLNIYNEDRAGSNYSLGEYINKRFNDTVEKLWSSNSSKLNIARDAIELFEKWVLSYEGAFSWYSIAAESDFVESEGNQQLSWMGRGYKTILDVLMKKYPDLENSLPIDDKILLNKEVQQIIWNVSVDDQTKVSVICSDESNFTADHVILTVSLGVLKERYKTLIVPSLPEDKVRAIEDLGFDAVFKVFFRFTNRWWSDTFEGYTFMWSPHDLEKPDMFFEGPVKNEKSWITSILAIFPVPGNNNVLEAWFTGEFVPEIELCSNETLINGFMYLMSRFDVCDFRDLIRPESLIRDTWYSNPHFKGTYSYQTVKSRVGDRSKAFVLSEPLGPHPGNLSLLFAGEATHPTQFSTVHGAIDSGFREADRLLKIYK